MAHLKRRPGESAEAFKKRQQAEASAPEALRKSRAAGVPIEAFTGGPGTTGRGEARDIARGEGARADVATEEKLALEEGKKQEEQRGEAFQQETNIQGSIGTLKGKIKDKPSLKPASIFFPSAEEGARRRLERFGTTSKIPAVGAAITAGLLVGVALPSIVAFAARSVIVKSMTTKITSLNGVNKGLLAIATAGGILNFNGLEMRTQRAIIGGYVEDGEKLIAIDKASGDHAYIIELLEQAAAEVDESERILQIAGRKNILNRISTQWKDDMNNIRTAREAILRRFEELNVIAVTGQATLQPDDLLFQASNF